MPELFEGTAIVFDFHNVLHDQYHIETVHIDRQYHSEKDSFSVHEQALNRINWK